MWFWGKMHDVRTLRKAENRMMTGFLDELSTRCMCTEYMCTLSAVEGAACKLAFALHCELAILH